MQACMYAYTQSLCTFLTYKIVENIHSESELIVLSLLPIFDLVDVMARVIEIL